MRKVAGALMKTLLDLSLETPLVNGLCFSQVFGSDLTSLSERLAVSAVNMGALVQAGLNSYEGGHYVLDQHIVFPII